MPLAIHGRSNRTYPHSSPPVLNLCTCARVIYLFLFTVQMLSIHLFLFFALYTATNCNNGLIYPTCHSLAFSGIRFSLSGMWLGPHWPRIHTVCTDLLVAFLIDPAGYMTVSINATGYCFQNVLCQRYAIKCLHFKSQKFYNDRTSLVSKYGQSVQNFYHYGEYIRWVCIKSSRRIEQLLSKCNCDTHLIIVMIDTDILAWYVMQILTSVSHLEHMLCVSCIKDQLSG